jgi:hypothetical protein
VSLVCAFPHSGSHLLLLLFIFLKLLFYTCFPLPVVSPKWEGGNSTTLIHKLVESWKSGLSFPIKGRKPEGLGSGEWVLPGNPPDQSGSLPRVSQPPRLPGTCQDIDHIWRTLKTWGQWHKNHATGKCILTTNNILTEKPLSPSSDQYSYFIPTKAVTER